MLSYWEREHLISFDSIVIGAGIVGINTAIHLKKLRPKAKIVVLEKGLLPSGASTKNAGFACFGSSTELTSDLKKFGQDKLLSLVEKRWKGLQNLRELVGDENIDFEASFGYDVILRNQEFDVNIEKIK